MEFSNWDKDTVDPRTMGTTQPSTQTFSGQTPVSSPGEYQSPYPPATQAPTQPPTAMWTVAPPRRILSASTRNQTSMAPPPPRPTSTSTSASSGHGPRHARQETTRAMSRSTSPADSSDDQSAVHVKRPIADLEEFMREAKKEWQWHLNGRKRVDPAGSSNSTISASLPMPDRPDTVNVDSEMSRPSGTAASRNEADANWSTSPPHPAIRHCAAARSVDASTPAISDTGSTTKRRKVELRLDLRGTEFVLPSEEDQEHVI